MFSWTRTSPRKRKAPTVREQFVETRRVLLSETETNEEQVERENASESEEGEANKIEGITKQDVATQTNEIRSKDDSAESDKEMNSQLIDLKTKLERANRHIESLQQQMFTVDRFRGDPSGFIVAFQTGIHSMLFLNT